MKDNDFIKRVTSALARNKNKRAFDRSMMHPEREWFVAIFIVSTVIGASAFWNIIQYREFSGVSVQSGEAVAGNGVYNGGAVFTALTELEERQKEYNELKNSILVNKTSVITPAEVEVEENAPEAVDEPEVEERVVEEVVADEPVILEERAELAI